MMYNTIDSLLPIYSLPPLRLPLPSTGSVDYMLPQSRDSLRDLVRYSVTPVPKVIIRDIVEICSCFWSLPRGEREDAWVC